MEGNIYGTWTDILWSSLVFGVLGVLWGVPICVILLLISGPILPKRVQPAEMKTIGGYVLMFSALGAVASWCLSLWVIHQDPVLFTYFSIWIGQYQFVYLGPRLLILAFVIAGLFTGVFQYRRVPIGNDVNSRVDTIRVAVTLACIAPVAFAYVVLAIMGSLLLFVYEWPLAFVCIVLVIAFAAVVGQSVPILAKTGNASAIR